MDRTADAMSPFWERALGWWPWTLATVMIALMAVALVCIALRLLRMVRGLPGGYLPIDPPKGASGKIPLRTWGLIAAAILGGRAFLYLWAWAINCLYSQYWTPPLQNFQYLWDQWDAAHYLKLAEQWYTAPGVAGAYDHLMLVFFPMFPLMLRGLRVLLGGNTLLAATLLNAACSVGAGCVLYTMTAAVYGRSKACLAVSYLFLNPFSLFLAAPYPEALFLLLTLLALDQARRRHYLWAGFFGALSAYTRMLGLIVLGVIFLEGLQHWLEDRAMHRPLKRLTVAVLCGIALVGVGFGAYLLLNWQLHGNPFMFLEFQKDNWSQQFGSFWYSAYNTARYMLMEFFPNDGFLSTWIPQAVSMVVVAALIGLVQRKLPLTWAAYAWVYVFVALAPTWLLSGPRYLMVLAVLPVMQCVITGRKWLHTMLLTLQGVLLLTYTYLFVVVRNVL